MAALTALPRVYFAAGVLLFAVGAAAMFVEGALRGRDGSFRGYRLLPILAVLALSADLFFLPPLGGPREVSALARRDVNAFAAAAQAMATPASVPTSAGALERAARELGRPPYLVRAERPERYAVRVRTGCQGPAANAQGEGAGTLVYCVAADSLHAWVTVVALPIEQKFGAPAVLSLSGVPYAAEVTARTPARSDEEEPIGGSGGAAPRGPIGGGGRIRRRALTFFPVRR